MNVLLIFDMHDLNGALLFTVSYLFFLLALLVPVTLILAFTTIYTSLWSLKSDLSIGVLTPFDNGLDRTLYFYSSPSSDGKSSCDFSLYHSS